MVINVISSVDKLWWQKIDEKCSEYGISQSRLSAYIGISQRQLIRLKTGETKLSESRKNSIENAIERLNPNGALHLLIDYVRFRLPTTDVYYVINQIMRLRIDHMIHENFAFNGYEERYTYLDVTISASSDIRLGCLVEMKGKGCRQFEGILEAQDRSWYDFFLLVMDEKGVFKRIDLAIDDVFGILDISELETKCDNRECISKFKQRHQHRSGKLYRYDEKDDMGETLYLGSTSSDIYFCIYEKDYEQYIKNGVPIEDACVKNRFEIRLKNKRAENAIIDLLTYRDAERTAFSIINYYVRFVDAKQNIPREDWELNPMWEHFIGEQREKLKLTTAPEEPSMEKSLNWLSHQVAPTLKTISIIDEINGTNTIEKLFSETHLSEKHRKLIKQMTTPFDEVINKH